MAEAPLLFSQLDWHAWLTLGVTAMVVLCLMREWWPPVYTLVGALAILLLSGTLTPEGAFSGFSNSAMLSIAFLYVVAAGVRRSRSLDFLAGWLGSGKEGRLKTLGRILIPVSFLSSFLNNTPVVALMTPLVQKWCNRKGLSASKFLLPLSYATILGGMGTLVGTSTNLLVSGILEESGHEPLGMFELMWIGLPAMFFGFIYLFLAGSKLLPERKVPLDVNKRGGEYQFEVKVPESSDLVGKTVEAAGLRHLGGAFLVHVIRRGVWLGPARPEQILDPGDLLAFAGNPAALGDVLKNGNLERTVAVPGSEQGPALPLFEAVVSHHSSLVGKTLKQADFRDRFQAAVLGIQRGGERLEGALGKTTIHAGDYLLIEARQSFAERLTNRQEFYLVAEMSPVSTTSGKTWSLLVLLALVVAVATGFMPMVTASFSAALALVLLGLVRGADVRKELDVNVLVIIAAALGLGHAILGTGLSSVLAHQVVELAAPFGVLAVLATIYIMTNLLTEFLTNSVAAVLVMPIGLSVAIEMGVDPRAFAVAIAIAASASFATPFGYQTNLMVMGPGGYRVRDYLRLGLPLNVLIFSMAMVIIPKIWW